MQIGSFARSLLLLSVVAALGFAPSAKPLMAQFLDQSAGYGTSAGPGEHQPGAVQALFMSSGRRMFGARQSPYMDANGNPVIVPAGYFQQCPGGCPGGCGGPSGGYGGPAPCGPPEYGDGYGGHAGSGGHAHHGGFTGPSYPMGAGGTNPAVGYALMEDVGVEGFLVDQRGPHYFDVRAEAVYMEPDETFGRDIAFTSENVGSNVVLSSGQLDYEFETGFRVLGRFDICPLAVLEFGYMGIDNFESIATFTDPDINLFSLFSRPAPGFGDFGTNPAGVQTTGGPMPQSERALTHTIAIDMQLHTAEMTYRRYWVGFIPRISGTLLAGARYTRYKEDFQFHADAPFRSAELPDGSTVTDPAASFDYLVRADNDLAGFQTGADIWIGLMQGIRIGAEGKVGIFNNHYSIDNIIIASPAAIPGRPFSTPVTGERLVNDQPALITEASADIVADVLPSVTLRAGYEVMFLNSIVTAGDNFNEVSPYGNQGTRVPFVFDQGNQFFQAWHAGFEYIW